MEARIRIPIADEKFLKSVIKALEPDNKSVPEGIIIDIQIEPRHLSIVVKAIKSIEILTFRNTIDDLLEHLATIFRVFNTLTRKR
ncbi:MAG: hypothetical protein DRO15_01190 [Thermoprotei archaeon]|nr:MAG: hypothetical protein DRO15_01190 [Thermoprotei archaeon]